MRETLWNTSSEQLVDFRSRQPPYNTTYRMPEATVITTNNERAFAAKEENLDDSNRRPSIYPAGAGDHRDNL